MRLTARTLWLSRQHVHRKHAPWSGAGLFSAWDHGAVPNMPTSCSFTPFSADAQYNTGSRTCSTFQCRPAGTTSFAAGSTTPPSTMQCHRAAQHWWLACNTTTSSQHLATSACQRYSMYVSSCRSFSSSDCSLQSMHTIASPSHSQHSSFIVDTSGTEPSAKHTLLPRQIILVRHAADVRVNLNRVPNHRVPLSAEGVQEAKNAGLVLRQLVSGQSTERRHLDSNTCSSSSGSSSSGSDSGSTPASKHGPGADKAARLFVYTSPYLRCIQTMQHMLKAGKFTDEEVLGVQEEVQLREQDWGNFFKTAAAQEETLAERLQYGRFFFRFPEGESAADVHNRLMLFQTAMIRDITCGKFGPDSSLVMVTHGLTLRLFLMRWLNWSVDEFLEVYNIPTAQPVVLQHVDSLDAQAAACCDEHGPLVTGPPPQQLQQLQQQQQQPPQHLGATVQHATGIKQQYRLMPEAQVLMPGISDNMCSYRAPLDLEKALRWRPYWKQMPPPPEERLEHEAALQALMQVGYGGE